MNNSFDIKFSALKGAPNILYLDDDGNKISEEEFEKELDTGYRAAILLMPVSNAIQLQVAMMTPYHKDHYQLDPQFVVENYNEHLRNEEDYEGEADLLDTSEDEFYIGEIEHA